ncbi:MAG: flagellar biosynthesis protein FlhF [Negativicutes bacterium]|nr:flagellar biosynthesis protein FlhF [Negativicutes bacterium]
MKVKVFTATNMQDAVSQVKNDLGREAVILHTRRYRKGGFLGFFARDMVEVMAALETPAPVPAQERKVTAPSTMIPRTNDEDAKITSLQMEISSMRKMVEQLITKMPRPEKQHNPLYDTLLKNDVEATIAENLTQGLPTEQSIIGNNPEIARQLLLERITNYLQRVEGITLADNVCKTVAFIGPTGVGKTTTIAKLAAHFALSLGHRVAMVTADTYRISAVEQLKTYAEIIDIPVEIVYTPDEMKAAIYRHRDKQLVLIDTAGRSPRNQYHLAELQALLAVDPYIETHLVLNTATKYSDALEIVNRFSVCSPQKFLFTKVDEAMNLGTILNLLYQFPATLSYITTGQNVPDDIELANPSKLANQILRD